MSRNSIFIGQVAVLTGASRGIGKATARQLASCGVHLVMGARSIGALQTLAQELTSAYPDVKIKCVQTDVTSPKECQSLIQTAVREFGRLDILINNAGVGAKVSLLPEVTVDSISDTIDTNLKAPFYLAKYALEPMVAQQSGTIVNIDSIAGKTAFPYWAVYDATKAGLKAMTEALCEEQRSNNIRVLGIYPGAVDTDIWDSVDLESAPNREGMLQPDQIAEAVVFALKQPSSVFVSDITIQPTKPAL
jgi:NADP-dependent 3-hydroxy acid dehydrogenase YdfG